MAGDAEISLAFSLLGTEQFKSSNDRVINSMKSVRSTYEGLKKQMEDVRKFSMAASMAAQAFSGNFNFRGIIDTFTSIGSVMIASKIRQSIPKLTEWAGKAVGSGVSNVVKDTISGGNRLIREASVSLRRMTRHSTSAIGRFMAKSVVGIGRFLSKMNPIAAIAFEVIAATVIGEWISKAIDWLSEKAGQLVDYITGKSLGMIDQQQVLTGGKGRRQRLQEQVNDKQREIDNRWMLWGREEANQRLKRQTQDARRAIINQDRQFAAESLSRETGVNQAMLEQLNQARQQAATALVVANGAKVTAESSFEAMRFAGRF